MIIEKVRETVNAHNMLQSGDRVLCALSGGIDSICLLDVLCTLKETYSLEIFAAHLNHSLRGEDSDRDEQFVRALCAERGISLFTQKVNIAGIAKAQKISVELAAREERYRFFEKLASENTLHKIAVAHHANDHAETVLFHMIRGCGLKGLGGILPVRGNIIRPLLFLSRGEIEEHLKQRGLAFVFDLSNNDILYTRNKIRHEILPVVNNINPNYAESFLQLSQIALDAQAFLEDCAQKEYSSCVCENSDSLRVNKELFLSLPNALRYPLLSLCFRRLGEQELPLKLFQEILYLFQSAHVSKRKNCFNLEIISSYTCVVLKKKLAEIPSFFQKELLMPEGLLFSKRGRYRISYRIEPFCEKNMQNIQKKFNIAYLDYDKMSFSLFVRERKSGDSYRPVAFSGTKLLKKMMIDRKIEKNLRDEIPVFVSGDTIAWVYSFPVSEHFKVDETTKTVLIIKISEESIC